MKRASIALLLLLFCGANDAFSQNFNWSTQAGQSMQDAGTAIAVDAEGFSYVTGYFQGTVQFQSTTLTSAGGSRDIFVAKYSRNGLLVWVKQASGPMDEEGDGIAIDSGGNVYVTGTFEGTVNFGLASLTSSGNSDMFIAKYTATGVPQFINKGGGLGQDGGNGIAVNPTTGYSYVTGSFTHTAMFSNNNSFVLTSAGSADIFIVCHDQFGIIQWVQKAGGANPDVGVSISVDGQSNTYVTGQFRSQFTWGTTTVIPAADDAFVAKYNHVGVVQWVRTMKGPGFDAGLGISVDAAGGPYVAGTYTDNITFSNSTTSLNSGPSNGAEIFVARYDTNGQLLWARLAGGPLNDRASGICVRGKSDVYVTGMFGGTATFIGQPPLTSSGVTDIFVARYTPNGVLQWVQRAGGSQFDYGRGIGVDSKGFAYVTGGYHSHPASFPTGGGSLTNTSTGAPNFFLARIQ